MLTKFIRINFLHYVSMSPSLNLRTGLILTSVAVAGITIAIFAANASTPAASQSATAAVGGAVELGTEQFIADWEVNEKLANQKARTNPEIVKYTDGALFVDSEYYPAALVEDNTDRIYMQIIKSRTVVGDWQTSYTVTHSGHSEIVADLTGGEITNVRANPAPDETYVLSYTDESKQLIARALEDPNAQKLLSGNSWFVRHIHSTVDWGSICPFGSCHSILIDEKERNETVGIVINSDTNQVIQVSATPGWGK